MPGSNICTVVTAVPDLESAKVLAQRLIGSPLADCAKMMRTDSIYWWKEKLEETSEYAVVITVRSADFDSVRMTVLQSHPYDLPMVLKYDIDDGNQAYFDWDYQSTNVPDFIR